GASAARRPAPRSRLRDRVRGRRLPCDARARRRGRQRGRVQRCFPKEIRRMSVDATAGAVSPRAAGAEVIAGGDVRRRDTAGLLFARISVLSALGAMAWLLGGCILLLAVG